MPSPVGLRSIAFLQDAVPNEDVEQEEVSGATDVEEGEVSGAKDLYEAELLSLETNLSHNLYPSTWAGTIRYAGSIYIVDSDVLRVVAEEKKEKKEEEETTKVLPAFDWDNMAQQAMRRVAGLAMDQMFCMSFDSVKNVVMEQIGEDKSCPVKLQVKALQDFKVGELVLAPYSLRADENLLVSASDDVTAKKYMNPDTSQMSATSIPRVFLKVFCKEKDLKRKRVGNPEEPECEPRQISSTFYANSALFSQGTA